MRLYMQNRPVDMQLPTGAGLYFGLRFAIMYAMSDLSHSPSSFMARRKANNEMPLAKELIINTFFKSIRDTIGEDRLTHDEEIILVLECMNAIWSDEEANAETLSQYMGMKV